MRRTDEEVQWALDLKRAAVAASYAEAEGDAEAQVQFKVNADQLSDLEYLQYAIVTKGNVNKALKRIQRMQALQKQFGIQFGNGNGNQFGNANGSNVDPDQDDKSKGTAAATLVETLVEQAQRDLNTFYAVHEGLYLAIGALPDETHVLCSDYHRAMQFFKKGEGLKIRMRGLFYHLQACQPNIAAMRAGFCTLLDFENSKWTDFQLNTQRKMSEMIGKAYPIRGKQMVLLNANAIVVAFWQIAKFFLPQKLRERTVLCANNHEEFFSSSIYPSHLLPRAWGGTFDSSQPQFMQAVMEKLEERYKLQATFRLQDDEIKEWWVETWWFLCACIVLSCLVNDCTNSDTHVYA